MTTRQSNIKNRAYYFYNDLINILNFEASNLKLDKKTSVGLDIYYFGYFDKKPEWNVNSVNLLYLMINRIDVFIEKNGVKYLNISDTGKISEILKKYNQIFNGIKYHIKKINDNDSEYEKDYMKIKFNTDDDIPFNKELYFPTITVVIHKYYSQVYLDECFYQA